VAVEEEDINANEGQERHVVGCNLPSGPIDSRGIDDETEPRSAPTTPIIVERSL
jgi:hypothetical protein